MQVLRGPSRDEQQVALELAHTCSSNGQPGAQLRGANERIILYCFICAAFAAVTLLQVLHSASSSNLQLLGHNAAAAFVVRGLEDACGLLKCRCIHPR
jgi:hypothetical protein